nr:zinc finger, CCHC-type [Tanacetum cinerariifolium]
MKVDGIIDKFKARFVIQGFRQKEGIDYFVTYAPVARITTIRLLFSLAEAYSDASWINHIEVSSSMSRWVFLLRGGAILYAFKKQTCIIGSTIESEFVALAAAASLGERPGEAWCCSGFIDCAAQIWLEKEPPRLIFNWDDLVSKFINHKAWDRFKDLLRACPHHGFSELHQLDTFYNALNYKDQDSLNSAAKGNFLDKMPCECLGIIESKSKVLGIKCTRHSHCWLESFHCQKEFPLPEEECHCQKKSVATARSLHCYHCQRETVSQR